MKKLDEQLFDAVKENKTEEVLALIDRGGGY